MALVSSPKTCTNTLRKLRCSSSSSSRSRRRGRSHHAHHVMAIRTSRRRSHACSQSSKLVSDKLEALKNLIPSSSNAGTVKAEQLFIKTADYIVMLRTQVVVLQRLIEFYGSN